MHNLNQGPKKAQKRSRVLRRQRHVPSTTTRHTTHDNVATVEDAGFMRWPNRMSDIMF